MNSPTDDGKYLARALQQQNISVRGARTHNLKNIDLDIPRNQLVVITGLSGSGKSSLAFDTLYAEGQRRYVESLSTYARQFLQLMDKPDVDMIEGLSPAISIEQKATSHNPRSTVGTVTEIHDYLRLLFARAGTPFCPDHNLPLQSQTVSQMVDAVLALPEETKLMILAPVAREKKGEFLEVFADMQAQGYVRFRINGEAVEAENLPKLKKTEKHDIDVVVDRIKVRADLKQRLAESFEAALRLAGGRAIALEMDTGAEHLFNAKFACPICNYSIAELEPRLFSFNSPVGACPTCDGLGNHEFFDPTRVVAFPTLSLASGAIKGWDRRNGYYFSMLESLAKHYQFDIDASFESLPEHVRNAILFGSGEEEIKFSYVMDSGAQQGKKVTKKHPFEGIIPNMQRRYRETDSALVREDLGRLRSTQPCPDCGGSRLRKEARHVKVGEGDQARAIYEISHATLRESFDYFNTLQMPGARGEIASKVIREIGLRLKFLNDVGLNYLSLDRSAETLSGGESQRIRLASQIGSGLTGVMYVLDEPSIGLHQRDNDRLIGTLQHLRDIGNSVLVVEHDEDMMRAADHVIDMGLGAGVHGGRVIAQGTFDEVKAHPDSLTGQYLAKTLQIEVPKRRTPWLPVVAEAKPVAKAAGGKGAPSKAALAWAERQAHHIATQGDMQAIRISGASGHNLKNVNVDFPVGLLTCVTGVSGSGKSTLVNDTLYAAVARQLYRAHDEPAAHESIDGIQYFDKVINVDQSPDWPHAAKQPGHLHRPVHPHPRADGRGTHRARTRLRPGALQLQRGRRPLRSLPGRRHGEGGDALSARRVRALRRVRRAALQPRDAGSALQGQEHRADSGHDGGSRLRVPARRAHHRAQAANPAGRGPVLHPPGPGGHHAVGRRGAAREAGAGTLQARHRPHALHPGRAHHRPALCRHCTAAQGAAPAARRGQHHRHHRAQPGRDQNRGLADRHRPRRRRRWGHGGGRGHAGRHCGQPGQPHGAVFKAASRRLIFAHIDLQPSPNMRKQLLI
ncbi:excinuclease ABC subunit UvrA [Rhodoferax sp.]|uniref:excinuclease ABC subunit UvrA n=1 Tax=Rhodoferax sp. TaxID=50421 RepID=UPI003A100CDD